MPRVHGILFLCFLDPGDVPAAPVGKRRRSSRDHR